MVKPHQGKLPSRREASKKALIKIEDIIAASLSASSSEYSVESAHRSKTKEQNIKSSDSKLSVARSVQSVSSTYSYLTNASVAAKVLASRPTLLKHVLGKIQHKKHEERKAARRVRSNRRMICDESFSRNTRLWLWRQKEATSIEDPSPYVPRRVAFSSSKKPSHSKHMVVTKCKHRHVATIYLAS